jgi:hypothetical protein
MLKHKPLVMGSVVIALVGTLAPLACGPPPPPPGTGGAPGTGGTGGTPTEGPMGCAADSQMTGGSPGATAQNCPDTSPTPLPLDSFPSCSNATCAAAHCIPSSLIPTSVDQRLLGNKGCTTAGSLCVPDELATRIGKFKFTTCRSIGGAEGRCVSTCIPQVNGLMDVLPRDTCGQNERCAPCFNPNDGTNTGACNQGCDTGPSAQTQANPYVFQKCQGTQGVCAPLAAVPKVLQTQLIQDLCPVNHLCAPIKKTQNLKYNFPACQPQNPAVALLAGVGPNGQTGGCVPQFLADNNPLEGAFMGQDSCQVGEKCAPCNNPLRGGAMTGACPVPLCSDASGGNPPGAP